MKDHYETLGVSPRSEAEVIHAAYKALMRKYHPDQTGSESHGARARDINEAFAILGDEAKRREYDRTRQMDMFARSSSRASYAAPPHSSANLGAVRSSGVVPPWVWAGLVIGAILGLLSLAPLVETAWSANLLEPAAHRADPMALVAGHAAPVSGARPGSSVLSASLDCAHALRPVEHRVCGNPELAAREVQMGRLYDNLEARLRWRERAALREGQDSWLSERDLCATDDCIAKAYDQRITALSAIKASPAPALPDAISPRFDCNLVRSWAQETVCQDPALAVKDVKVSGLHDRLRRLLPTSEVLSLLDSEAKWSRERDSCLTASCLADIYDRRAEALTAQLESYLAR